MIAASARASAVFGQPAWLDVALLMILSWCSCATATGGCCMRGGGPAGARSPRRLRRHGPCCARPVRGQRPAWRSRWWPRRWRSGGVGPVRPRPGGVDLTAKDGAQVPGARPRQVHDGAHAFLGRPVGRCPPGSALPTSRAGARWWSVSSAPFPARRRAVPARFCCWAATCSAAAAASWSTGLCRRARRGRGRGRRSRRHPSLTVLRLDRLLWPNGLPREDCCRPLIRWRRRAGEYPAFR